MNWCTGDRDKSAWSQDGRSGRWVTGGLAYCRHNMYSSRRLGCPGQAVRTASCITSSPGRCTAHLSYRSARSDLGARSESDVDAAESKAAPRSRGIPKKSCRDQLSSPVEQSTTVRSRCDGATTTAFLLKRPSPLSFFEEDTHTTHTMAPGMQYASETRGPSRSY